MTSHNYFIFFVLFLLKMSNRRQGRIYNRSYCFIVSFLLIHNTLLYVFLNLDQMNHNVQLFLYVIFVLYQLQELSANLLLINDPAYVHYTPYRIISADTRVKRDKSALLSPENNQCDQYIYTKLYSCSQLTDCT